jgi:hypothetical protein
MSVFQNYVEMLGGEVPMDTKENLIVFVRLEPEFFHKVVSICKRYFKIYKKQGMETKEAVREAVGDFGADFGRRALNLRMRRLFDRLMEMQVSFIVYAWEHGLFERKMKDEEYI